MSLHCFGPRSASEPRDPLDCDEQTMNALATVGAFVALADGRVDAVEREALANYFGRQRLAPSISRPRIAEYFDTRARQLQDRDVADLIAEALRPVAALSLSAEVIGIAEQVAAADRYVHPSEVQAIMLLRLIMMDLPEPKVVGASRKSSGK